jgi:Kef-type K+ transport system membrane component KefB
MPALYALQEQGAGSAVGAKAEEIVLHLLYQLLAIFIVTRIVTLLARRLGQTDVSGEILAGLLLGPSLLSSGLFGTGWQSFMGALFHPSTSLIFVGIAQIGLVLLMFQIGLEFEFRTHLGEDRRPIVAISLTGLVLPFVAGCFAAPWFYERLPEPVKPPLFGFRLFFGVAMASTAIPILGRIFMELGLSHTRTAALTIGAAAIDDVSGWLILGAIALMVQGQFSPGWALPRVLGLAAYLAVVFAVVRPLLKRAVKAHLDRHGRLQMGAVAWMLVLLFVSAAITSQLGVFAIIGGFVIGAALHEDRRFVEAWKERVAPLVQTFFLPVFFAYTGLRTDIGTLPGWNGVWLLLLVCAVAFATKFGGAYAAARLVGEDRRSAFAIGVCMNTRALMELIALNIGRDLGVLPPSMFTMLVIMAIASTFMATPLIRIAMKGQERTPAPVASAATQGAGTSEEA